MTSRCTVLTLLIGVSLACGSPAFGQDPEALRLLAAQKEAMKKVSFISGVWRGPAWTVLPGGKKHEITQTERMGDFLDGTVKVIEGRGYDPDGKVTFNALGVVSYDVAKKQYMMRSYAQGRSGDFVLNLTNDGFVWEIQAGPGMTIRYTATIKDGAWKEVGDRIMNNQAPVSFFEMNLKRISDTDWPSAGTIPPK